MTLMVRDEADIIAAMVEHHLAQGVDLIIATDNASRDGTREILTRYAERGFVELHDDSRHDKPQSEVVTAMARRACAVHGATWVINADADEFWLPVDRSLTLRTALAQIPDSLRAFTAPVVNLTGTPARRGAGIGRLTWRDHRPDDRLMDLAGLHAQPTANAVHVGSTDVEVAQGNHFVSIESRGQPSPELAIEVLHLPWRSLTQYQMKVEMTGRAYDSSLDRRPSPKHHGMRDYRRLLAGHFEAFYLYRHPIDPEHDPDFVAEPWLFADLVRLAAGTAVFPELVAQVLENVDDAPYTTEEIAASAAVACTIIPVELVHLSYAERAREDYRSAVADRQHVQRIADKQKACLERRIAELEAELANRRRSILRRAADTMTLAAASARKQILASIRQLSGR